MCRLHNKPSNSTLAQRILHELDVELETMMLARAVKFDRQDAENNYRLIDAVERILKADR